MACAAASGRGSGQVAFGTGGTLEKGEKGARPGGLAEGVGGAGTEEEADGVGDRVVEGGGGEIVGIRGLRGRGRGSIWGGTVLRGGKRPGSSRRSCLFGVYIFYAIGERSPHHNTARRYIRRCPKIYNIYEIGHYLYSYLMIGPYHCYLIFFC